MKSSNRKFWVGSTATLALVLIVLVSVIAVVMNKQEPGAAHQSLNQRGSTVEPMMGGGLYAPVETFCDMGTCPI